LVESKDRLACYDKIYPPKSPAAAKAADFGKEQIERQRAKNDKLEDTQIASTIVSLERRARGIVAYHLTNGQTWAQTQARRNTIRENDQVIVKRGRLGGYTLTNQRGVSSFVRRIQ
jgi:hypothetical protein